MRYQEDAVQEGDHQRDRQEQRRQVARLDLPVADEVVAVPARILRETCARSCASWAVALTTSMPVIVSSSPAFIAPNCCASLPRRD